MTGKLLIGTASLALGAGAWPAASAAPAGCAAHWKVVLNDESFAHNGAGRVFSSAELAAFRAKIEGALKGAIAEGCRTRAIKPALAARARRVTVTSASGHTEPFIYDAGKGELELYWVFAEDNLGIPSRKDILHGTTCWTSPKSRACALLQQD